MEELIKRVSEEKQELEGRIERLETFRGSEKHNRLSDNMKELLHRQYWCMKSYVSILDSRLDLMGKELALSYTE